MNEPTMETQAGSKRRFMPGRLTQWWDTRSTTARMGLRIGGVLALLCLATLLAFGGLALQQSVSARAAVAVQTGAAGASVSTGAEKTKCPAVNNNPWCYNFSRGARIYHPQSAFCRYFACVSDFWSATRGYVVECWNGEYSHSGGVRGVCSRDKKVRRTLYS